MKKILALITMMIVVSSCSSAKMDGGSSAPEPMQEIQMSESAEVEYYETTQDEALNITGEQPAPEGFQTNESIAEDSSSNLNGEKYQQIIENTAKDTNSNPLLTFSLKVDSASYRNVVRYLESNNLPPTDAVRIEEMINYFNYDKQLPENETPFAIDSEIGRSPFDENKYLAYVRVKSKELDKSQLPSSNLTFLIDTSGSMDSYDKLPLLKQSFELLVENLTEDDKISIVTYAGSSEIVLDSVPGSEKNKILKAINSLSASGSTAGANGILTAYKLAEKNFKQDGNNRVILATDGDFNVGLSSTNELSDLISQKRQNGVYLSILGFGIGNLNDELMESLSKNGNGNYGYIDSVIAAKKILVDELSANLYTIADDVKAQIEFNPNRISNYRLIGYENRRLRNEDFDDDTVDAGEIGIGTDVILMFELDLGTSGSSLKYNNQTTDEFSDELFEVKIRYKDPKQTESKLITYAVKDSNIITNNSTDYNFAKSVAIFGSILRESSYLGNATIADAKNLALDSMGRLPSDEKEEYIKILDLYSNLD